jgi:hypothetical protein
MRLFVRLDKIHGLCLVDDKAFVTRILPLVSGSLLTFLGAVCAQEVVGQNVSRSCWKSTFPILSERG